MKNKCKVKNDQTILLGNHIAADGEAMWDTATKTGQSYITISHIHNDHFKESKVNNSIANINSYIIEFFNDSLAFLLFQTEEKPFPFKSSSDEETIIDVDEIEEASSENEDSTSEQKEN